MVRVTDVQFNVHGTYGFMIKSTKAEIFSVGLPLPETIGLSRVGEMFLWIFGRR